MMQRGGYSMSKLDELAVNDQAKLEEWLEGWERDGIAAAERFAAEQPEAWKLLKPIVSDPILFGEALARAGRNHWGALGMAANTTLADLC
jgi:hypothetical protein